MEALDTYIYNKFAQALPKNSIFHDRTKHIDIRYHFIREFIIKKEVKFKYVKTQDQVANIFTELITFEEFQRLRAKTGVKKKILN